MGNYTSFLDILSTGMKTQAINEDASANMAASDYNAKMKEENAKIAVQQAADDERRSRVYSAQVLGSLRSSYSASGVDSSRGSALAVLQQSARNAELDALTIRHSGALKQWAYLSGAALDKSKTEQIKKARDRAVFGAWWNLASNGLTQGMGGGSGGGGGGAAGALGGGGADTAGSSGQIPGGYEGSSSAGESFMDAGAIA